MSSPDERRVRKVIQERQQMQLNEQTTSPSKNNNMMLNVNTHESLPLDDAAQQS